MIDPLNVRQAIEAGELAVAELDVTAHFGCCCTPKQREAAELCIGLQPGMKQKDAARLLGVSRKTIRDRLDAFRKKVKKCKRGKI
jgi:hypothetical protein